VKTTLVSLAGLITLGGFAASAGAQPPAQPPVRQASANAPAPGAVAPPQRSTAVAVVNMNAVLKNYNKAQQLNNQIRTEVQAFAAQMNQKRDEMQKLQGELTKPVAAQSKDQIEQRILTLQRELQDIDTRARKEISKKQGDIAVQIYREVEGVIQAVAAANGFDLVLSYPDATSQEEMYSQDNVVRKMASQAAIPLFYKPHIDLTQAVVTTLNARYPAAPASPGSAPAAPPRQ
jgi:Skp family chaperone for outer membrane proteins